MAQWHQNCEKQYRKFLLRLLNTCEDINNIKVNFAHCLISSKLGKKTSEGIHQIYAETFHWVSENSHILVVLEVKEL